jgi:crotonobetainyl-CoA:carnitine CoA-transferase CaiB-like acyl-CoA transferase
VSGYGESGPLAKAGCADPIMQAFSGFARLNGAPGDDLEAFRFTGFLDLTTAGLAAEAIMAALLSRETTGRGQHVGVSMLEAALEAQATRAAEWLGGGLAPRARLRHARPRNIHHRSQRCRMAGLLPRHRTAGAG